MKPIHKERLNMLIIFLDELDEERFTLTNSVLLIDDGCGSICCAIGWTPKIFPDLVRWTGERSLTHGLALDGNESAAYSEVAQELFGIDNWMAIDLFAPDGQVRVHSALPECGAYATPKEVANMLRKFLELVEAGEIPASFFVD